MYDTPNATHTDHARWAIPGSEIEASIAILLKQNSGY